MAAYGCGHGSTDAAANGPAPMPTMQVVAAARGSLVRTLSATGTLSTLPNAEAVLSPQVGGTLLDLPVAFGQTVRKGDIVARISTQQLMGQIEQAQATYDSDLIQVEQAEANAIQQEAQTRGEILQAKASLRNAEAALAAAGATLTGDAAAQTNADKNDERARKLFADGLIAQRDLEAARLAAQTADSQVEAQKQTVEAQRQTVAGAQAALDAAEAGSLMDTVKRKDILVARQQCKNALGALETAKAQLALYTIRAPLAGVVTQVGAAVGESVDTTTKLVTISNLDRLQLQIAAPSSLARTIGVGDAIEFHAEALPGRSFSTTVATISPQVDSASGSVPIVAAVPNSDHALKDDMTVSVEIVTARAENAIVVPASAILTDPDSGDKSVMVVGSDSVARQVDIQTGLESDGKVEVVSGLSVGQRVAVSGQFGISDGTSVHAETATGASPDGA
jgi:RND family efflux transporter MFP subunit